MNRERIEALVVLIAALLIALIICSYVRWHVLVDMSF